MISWNIIDVRRSITFLSVLVVLLVSCSSAPKEPEEIYTRRKQADSLMDQGNGFTDILAFESAQASYDEALKVYSSLDNRAGMVNALLALGRINRVLAGNDAASEFYYHAESLSVKADDPETLQRVYNHRADLALRQGDPVAAAELLEDRTVPMLSGGRERAAQLRLLGTAKHAMGAEEEAVALLREAASVAEAADETVEAAQAYYKLASIASLAARFEEARSWALLALEADKKAEYGPGIAADLRALAIIAEKAGDSAAAEDFARRAWLAWRGLGLADEAAEARSSLEKITGRPIGIL